MHSSAHMLGEKLQNGLIFKKYYEIIIKSIRKEQFKL